MTEQQTVDAAASHEERRAFRWRRVRLAFVASMTSKLFGTVLQIVVVPISVKALGVEKFGIYTIIVSSLAWIDLAKLGVGPGLTQALAVAWNRSEQETESRLFSNAFFFVAGSCLLVALGVALALTAARLWGFEFVEMVDKRGGSNQAEIYDAILVVSLLFLLQILCSVAEAARSAYQEDYANSIAVGLGSLVAVAVLLVSGSHLTSIAAFALAMFGSVFLSKGINLADLVIRARPYLRPRISLVRKETLKTILSSSAAFWCAQIGAIFITSLSVVQAGAMTGPVALAPFAVLFRLLLLAATIAMMFTMPLWPAITDACVRADFEWIRVAKRRLLVLVMGFSLVVAGIVALGGEKIVALWSGGSVHATRLACIALACYFPIWMWNHCHLMVLYGFGRLRSAGWTVLAEGSLALLLNCYFIRRLGSAGTAVGLAVAGILISAWILPLLVHRRWPARRADPAVTLGRSF